MLNKATKLFLNEMVNDNVDYGKMPTREQVEKMLEEGIYGTFCNMLQPINGVVYDRVRFDFKGGVKTFYNVTLTEAKEQAETCTFIDKPVRKIYALFQDLYPKRGHNT